MVRKNKFSKALKYIKKDYSLTEAPTNSLSGVYSLNQPGHKLGPVPKNAKIFLPDIDGNYPAGIPGTPGEPFYKRGDGHWTGERDWDTITEPNFSHESAGESGTDTTGLIAGDGTVLTALPPNSRSFILGPLVDGHNYNHGYDSYTNIGYIQKDTRQFVLLARVDGQWEADGYEPPQGWGPARVWDGTSNGFTAYNSNFTLEMAQWFRTEMLERRFVKDVAYFYSGGIFQSPNPDAPAPGMYGGSGVGAGGNGSSASGGGAGAGYGSGGDPNIGDPQVDNSGGPEDAGFPWGPNPNQKDPQDDLNDRYGHLSDEELRDRGYKRDANGNVVPMTDEEKAAARAEDELDKAKEEEKKALEELLDRANQLDSILNSDIKLASVTLTGIAIWQLSSYVTALIAAGYASYQINEMLNDAVSTITSQASELDKLEIQDITNIETSVFHIEADLNSDAEMADKSDAEWDQIREEQNDKENDAIIRVRDKLEKARNSGRESVIKAAEKALDKLKEIKAKNKFRRKQVTKLRNDAKKTVEDAKEALRQVEKHGIKLDDHPRSVKELLDALRDTSIKGQVKKIYMKRHLSDKITNLIKGLNNSYEPLGTTLSESRKIQILKEVKKPVVLIEASPKMTKLKGYRPNFKGKFTPQNTPDVTACKQSDGLVDKANARGQTWRTENRYWQGYETTERMNIVYDRMGHGQQAWDAIIEDARQKNGWKNREIQEQLNQIAHEKAMRKINPDFESPWTLKEMEDPNKDEIDKYMNDPLVKRVRKRLLTQIDYPDKPSKKGYPDEPPVEVDPKTGMHPKYGKNYKYDKLDPVSAVSMRNAPTGNPEIDANVEKSAKKYVKPKVVEDTRENWRDSLTNA